MSAINLPIVGTVREIKREIPPEPLHLRSRSIGVQCILTKRNFFCYIKQNQINILYFCLRSMKRKNEIKKVGNRNW